MRVLIVGNGIIANLCALHLRNRLPADVEIVIVGPESPGGMPVVGEATIEITAQFLENQLGLGDYLRTTHYPKYALTYYFKLDPQNPDDRRYSVQCNERDPADLAPMPDWEGPMARPPSWQLNRAVFDRDIRVMVDEAPGIRRVLCKVTDVALNQQGHHQVVYQRDGEADGTLETDWLIDASGRRQILAKKLKLTKKAKTEQRNCFWFRLTGFDRHHLKNLDALGPMPASEGEPYHYDRYYSTHHFMGRGNWIWLIPMRTADGTELMSIGISSRPDVYPHTVRSMDDFMEHVAKEHPVITDLVASGNVEDTNIFNNYRYVIEQAYSVDRWCIVGDAAFAPDPLFSNGLAFSTVQLEQVGEMIARDCAGEHCPDYIAQLEKVFWKPVAGSQNTIAKWYETMDDPLLCAPRLHWIEVSYFYLVLPLIVNRCHIDPERLSMWSFMRDDGAPLELPKKLLTLRQKMKSVTPEHFVYHGKEKVNLRALTRVGDLKELREQQLEAANLLDAYTEELMDMWANASTRTDSPPPE